MTLSVLAKFPTTRTERSFFSDSCRACYHVSGTSP